jgi:hypothetical protein
MTNHRPISAPPVTESVTLPPQRRGSIMPEAFSHSYPSLLPIDRPRCSKCQGRMMLSRMMLSRMMLSRIEPGPAHFDLVTFECPKCEHVKKMVVGGPDEGSQYRLDGRRS